MLGQLSVTIIGGHFNRDTDTFGKMELFVYTKLLAGEYAQEAKTTQRKGGRNETVVWNERMTFNVPVAQLANQARLYFEVRDEDVTNFDVVASGFANLLNGGFFTPGVPQNFNVNLYYDKKPAGVLQISTSYVQ